MDEDSGRIPTDTVSGSRADGAGWVLCGYGYNLVRMANLVAYERARAGRPQ